MPMLGAVTARDVEWQRSSEEGQPRQQAVAAPSFRVALGEFTSRAFAQVLRPPSAQGSNSARAVHEHQLEIFAEHFPVWVTGFAIMNVLTAPATLALFVWVVVSYIREDKRSCDVPLRTWVVVEFISAGCGLIHCIILQCFCAPQDDDEQIMPWYGRLYAVIVSCLDCAWTSVGLHWIRIAETCGDTSPELYKSVMAYTALTMGCFVFVSINAIGLYSILSWMLRNGMLNSRDGAPPGTLGRLKIVAFDAENKLFTDTPECCICLGTFCSGSGAEKEVRVSGCGHIFHSRCLGNWLRMRRSCPLCRQDVADTLQSELVTVGRVVDADSPVDPAPSA